MSILTPFFFAFSCILCLSLSFPQWEPWLPTASAYLHNPTTHLEVSELLYLYYFETQTYKEEFKICLQFFSFKKFCFVLFGG